jgi:hypothetical protein
VALLVGYETTLWGSDFFITALAWGRKWGSTFFITLMYPTFYPTFGSAVKGFYGILLDARNEKSP